MTRGRDEPPFGFERDKPGTNGRTEAEADIETLRQRGGLFVEAVARTRMPMAVTDARLPGNPIVFANDAFVRLSGYSMTEMMGQEPHFLNGPDTDPDDAGRFREALRRGEDIVTDSWQYRKDGSRFFAAVFVSPLLDEDGQVIQHFLSYLDLTRRVEAEQALRDHAAELEQVVETRMTTLGESQERKAVLLELTDKLTRLSDSAEMERTAVRMLGEKLGATQVFYATIGADEDSWSIQYDYADGVAKLAGRYPLSGFQRKRLADWQAGRMSSVADSETDPSLDAVDRAAYAAISARAAIGVPLVKGGQFAALLAVNQAQPRAWTEAELMLVKEVADRTWAAIERARAEEALRKSEERLRLIVENAEDYAIFTTDPAGAVVDWREGAEAVFGYSREEITGQDFEILFTPEDRADGQPEKERATAAEESKASDVRWHVRKDGARVFIDGISTALRDPKGQLIGFLKIGQDVTERRRSEEHQRVLLAELQHRVRNTLGVVRSIARRTAHNSDDVEEMAAHLDGRIEAFARVQAMVTRKPNAGVDLAALLDEELLAHAQRGGDQVTVSGPDVALPAKAAESLSLALHELTTNAVKYGALASERGRLKVAWTNGGERLDFTWEETGLAEPLAEPVREGFGFELLRRALPYELKATTSLDFRPEGLHFALSMPLDGDAQPDGAAAAALDGGP